MSKLKKLMIEKEIDISLLAASINVNDDKLEKIIEKDNIENYLDIMQLAELARVLDVEIDDLN
ncbi:helix-turn-helix domain-containing protein [Peptostreptococcus equinus]|uniref:Helix-turn-helix domain-containing protein n=1 Tax=Peptostreptococcus equinus TaxID=3003601 RepID=A0ABY7JPV2_9FIRM|nr:helix-turn-helix domain-containing protein [Peptostreptococcus sp. CBA3647]WAW14519.1 helix-turn-helix domain-containing protein [Peptostreptococcus sp. CBA3647]